MIFRCKYRITISRILLPSAFLVILVAANGSYAQDGRHDQPSDPFPPVYYRLNTDTARMRFLVKVMLDSLNNDRLTHLHAWARQGLAMAERNNVDTMKGIFNYFIAKAFTYRYLQPDSAIVYYKKVLPWFPNKMKGWNFYSVSEIMERYSDMGNKDSSLTYLDSLKALIDTMPEFSPRKIILSKNIATVYQVFGMFRTAIQYYQVAVNGNRKNGNIPGLGMALANLAELYDESKDDPKAIQYAREALGYLADENMSYSTTASNLATYYSNLEQFDSALVYLERSRSAAEKIGDGEQLSSIRVALAGIYLGQKKFDQAKTLLKNSEAALTMNGSRWNQTRTYLIMASLDTSLHNYPAAKDHLLKGLKIARENQQQVLVAIALQSLAAVNAQLGDHRTAFALQREFLLLQDSMTNEKTRASLADLEITYQTRQKEEQIRLLQQNNAIKDLQLQNHRRTSGFYLLASLMVLVTLGIVFYQRNLRNKIRSQKIKAELETKVLRLQMNPHFIFNCLNSIENFIMRNEKRLASDYLNKFARLIRMILDSSRAESVPIVKDMEALQLYVDLEQLRFDHKFSYKVHIDPALLGGDYRAPALLIQPYVENAIVHGLANSDEENLYLTVTATLEKEKIRYVIQDNGIGRDRSAEYRRLNKPYHQSLGLEITAERIHILNNDGDRQEAVKITDLYDEHRIPDGTRVEITINAV